MRRIQSGWPVILCIIIIIIILVGNHFIRVLLLLENSFGYFNWVYIFDKLFLLSSIEKVQSVQFERNDWG